MKKCQDCNFTHEALLDNCWQCGSRSIGWANAEYVPQSAQATVAFRSETPTYYAQNQQNYNTNAYNYATNNYQPPRSSVGSKLALAIGGVFTFLLLFSAVGAATYFKFVYRSVKPIPVTRVENPVVKETETVKKEEEKKTERSKKRIPRIIRELRELRPRNNRQHAKKMPNWSKMWIDYNVKAGRTFGNANSRQIQSLQYERYAFIFGHLF